MKCAKKEFYYVSHAHDTLTISISMLNTDFGKVRPILWNNRGLFCIISRQRVQNAFELIKDKQNLPVLNHKEMSVFHWDDNRLVDSRIAAMLLS